MQLDQLKRREFIALLGGAAAAWPLAGHAQQGERVRRVGVLLNLSENDLEARRLITAFREGLAQSGWTEGRNLQVDYRWAGGDVSRIGTFAKELVEPSPDIIVGYGTPVVVALQQQTRSIPIVFLSVTDPVGQRLVASLAHPGGNITGFAVFEISLGTKWMETSQADCARSQAGHHHLQSEDCTLFLALLARDRTGRPVICGGADWPRGSRRRRDRACHWRAGARAGRRADRHAGHLQHGASPHNHRTRCPASPAGNLHAPGVHHASPRERRWGRSPLSSSRALLTRWTGARPATLTRACPV